MDIPHPFKLFLENHLNSFTIPLDALFPGTNKISIAYPNGKKFNTQLINWQGEKPVRLETIDLVAFFNDKVTQIFKNK